MIYLRFMFFLASVLCFSMPAHAILIKDATATVQDTLVVLDAHIMPSAFAHDTSFSMRTADYNSFFNPCVLQWHYTAWYNQTLGWAFKTAGQQTCSRNLFPQGLAIFIVTASEGIIVNGVQNGESSVPGIATVLIDNTPQIMNANIPAVVSEDILPLTGTINFVDGGINGQIKLEIQQPDGTRYVKTVLIKDLFKFGGRPGAVFQGHIYSLDLGFNVSIPSWSDGQYIATITATAENGAQVITTRNFQINRAPTIDIVLDKTQVYDCDMVTGTVSVTDPMAQGGTIALTLPNGSVQTFAYQGGSGSFPVNYSVVSPVGSILSFDAVATSQAGRQSNKSTVSASVIAATYTAELIMPASVALGEFITGTLNISSASTCPANGVVNVCVAGFCDHISIQAVGSYPVNLPYVAFLPSFEMVSASGTVAGQPVDTAVIIEMGGTTPPPLLAPPGDPGPLPPIDSGTPIIIDLPAPPADTPLPDPATPISGGCGLTAIVTTGATVIYPWINNSREGNYPGKYSTPINIKVACGTRPAQGAEVLMRVDMIAGTETYGGHDHGVIDGANKPTGHVLAAFGITDIDGIFSTTYHASEFSGKDEITAVVTHNGLMTTSAPVIVTSKLPNLDPITLPAGSPHQFVGGRCEHYGASTPWNLGKTSACGDATGSSNQYISSSIAQTFYDFLNEYTLLHGAGLYINDASLKFGGMFDVNGGWCTTCSHSTHRIGVDVDFALKDTNASQGTLPVDMPNVWENIVFDNRNVEPIVSNNGKTIKIITPKISYQQHAVGTTNAHVHIFFIK